MRILLCCAGGFSTNMLMQNMKKVVKESAKLNEGCIRTDGRSHRIEARSGYTQETRNGKVIPDLEL